MKQSPRLHPFAAVFAVVPLAILAACQSIGVGANGPVPVVDGWEIGEQFDCSRPGDGFSIQECLTYIPVATAGLARRDPGHPPIVSSTLHHQPPPRGPNGEKLLSACSGGCMNVAVFHLLDGSVRALAVGTGGVMTEAISIDYGPLSPHGQE